MQIDMHYYGTYAMARAAGINADASQIIATCAQFVDDNTAESHVSFRDGSRIDQEATAHHPINRRNLEERDQRRVWVPFHFLPGNQGEEYTERLKCRMDSEIAREMVNHYLELSDREYALHLIGIAAHVYADTFSHYGFSGVSSRRNKVKSSSFRFHEELKIGNMSDVKLLPEIREYISKKKRNFFEKRGEHGGLFNNIKSWSVEVASGALGHGAVATFPDRPYLVWSFDYEDFNDEVTGKATSIRNNPETFLSGCQALHAMFQRFGKNRPEYTNNDARKFTDIEQSIREVLMVQGKKEERIKAWQNSASEGSIFGETGEKFLEYDGKNWNDQWDDLNDNESYTDAMNLAVWHFYQAAAVHRTYVLRDLLPRHGLIVN